MDKKKLVVCIGGMNYMVIVKNEFLTKYQVEYVTAPLLPQSSDTNNWFKRSWSCLNLPTNWFRFYKLTLHAQPLPIAHNLISAYWIHCKHLTCPLSSSLSSDGPISWPFD